MTYQSGIGSVWPERLRDWPMTDRVALLSGAGDVDELPTVVPAVVCGEGLAAANHRRPCLPLLLQFLFDGRHVDVLVFCRYSQTPSVRMHVIGRRSELKDQILTGQMFTLKNKRPTGLKAHLSTRDLSP